METGIEFDPNMLSQDYLLKLIDRLKVGSHDDNFSGCRTWDGHVNSTQGERGYGQIRVLMPVANGEKRSMKYLCHRVMISLARMEKIPSGSEASHICHNRRCIRVSLPGNDDPGHVIMESSAINSTRRTCFVNGSCSKQHQPHCILK